MNTAIKRPERQRLYEVSLIGDANLDKDVLADLWHLEGTFQIASMPRVNGREAIRGFFGQFFSMGLFRSLTHEMTEVWDLDDVLIYTAVAIYSRADGSTIRTPYTNTVKYKEGLFWDYRVYIDTKPLFG